MQAAGSLGERLRRHRRQAGLSAEQLAARAGTSASTVSRLESGQIRSPSLDLVARLASALGHGVGALLEESVPAFPAYARVLERTMPVYRWGTRGDPRDPHNPPNPDRLEPPPPGRESLIGSGGFGLEVRGEQLAHRRIHDGDVIWCNPDRPTRGGAVVVARRWDAEGRELGLVAAELPSVALDQPNSSREELVGPVVWVSPRGYPPD